MQGKVFNFWASRDDFWGHYEVLEREPKNIVGEESRIDNLWWKAMKIGNAAFVTLSGKINLDFYQLFGHKFSYSQKSHVC